MFGNRSILTERPRPEVIRRYPGAAWLAVGVVCFGAFMGQLDASIVTLTFRLVQAVGAAMLQANSVALVATCVPESAMRRALGVQAAAQALGLALGPTLGGIVTTTAGWRSVYWINVPVGCAAVVASRYLLPRTRQFSPGGHFDWPGTALLGLATTCLLLALSAVGGLSMPGWAAAGLAAAAAAAR